MATPTWASGGPSTGVWRVTQLDGTAIAVPSTPYGQAGDVPLAGNFTGDLNEMPTGYGIADQVVHRRHLGVFYRRDGASGATSTIAVGGGLPMPLDWDGDV